MYYLHTTSHIWRLFCEWILQIYYQLQSSCPLQVMLFPPNHARINSPWMMRLSFPMLGLCCYLPHSFTFYVTDTVQLCKYFFSYWSFIYKNESLWNDTEPARSEKPLTKEDEQSKKENKVIPHIGPRCGKSLVWYQAGVSSEDAAGWFSVHFFPFNIVL